VAVYDAVSGGEATFAGGVDVVENYPDHVRRTAMSIETFHKASLIHDDIEDNDQYRYGAETLHVKYGVPTGINVGDYMIGLGYRMVSGARKELGAEAAADILECDRALKPIDALKIYALKTAPAFEAAFYCGLRLAGPCEEHAGPVKAYARNLGVAFQILNDLKDWESDQENKKSIGADLLGGRPTLLLALALEGLSPELREELMSLVQPNQKLSAGRCV